MLPAFKSVLETNQTVSHLSSQKTRTLKTQDHLTQKLLFDFTPEVKVSHVKEYTHCRRSLRVVLSNDVDNDLFYALRRRDAINSRSNPAGIVFENLYYEASFCPIVHLTPSLN